jgi:flagellar protein FliJ
MSALNSIRLAIELAARQREQLQKAFAQVQRTRVFALNQMDQLERYAQDTQTRWTATAQASTTPELMRHHYQFMDRLRHAIQLQTNAIEDVDRQVEEARKSLLNAQIRVSSLEHLMASKQAALLKLQSRKEQKQMDEFAAIQYARRAIATAQHGEAS